MKYTPLELDQMRQHLWKADTAKGYDTNPDVIERELLTHMMNGTKPEELEAWVEEVKEQQKRNREWITATREADRRFCQHEWVYREAYPDWFCSSVAKMWQCSLCNLRDRRMTERRTNTNQRGYEYYKERMKKRRKQNMGQLFGTEALTEEKLDDFLNTPTRYTDKAISTWRRILGMATP